MKNVTLVVGCMMFLLSCSDFYSRKTLIDVVDSELDIARQQALLMAERMESQDSLLPRSFVNGVATPTKSRGWYSGFYPGELWYLYENYQDQNLLKYAQLYTSRIEPEKYNTRTHDLGFMLYCSFGNGWRLMNDTAYSNVLLTGANSLSTRYNKNIGLIQSWGSNSKWQYPVIIDNMMNLELLMWAYKASGDTLFRSIATHHADRTMKEHYRKDYSCYHVVSYDVHTYLPHAKNTAQGFSDESSWSRGQSWGLYGYTMMYRETKNMEYLEQAIHIADYLLHKVKMPQDYIPYWDYKAPDIPNALRDVSAGTIMCSALIELSGYVSPELAEEYLRVAEIQIRALASSDYIAKVGENGNFLLMHSVGSFPTGGEVDVPLISADYYYVESLMRMKRLLQRK